MRSPILWVLAVVLGAVLAKSVLTDADEPAPPNGGPAIDMRNTPVVWGAREDVLSGTARHTYHRLTCPAAPADTAPVAWRWAREEDWTPCPVCRPDADR